MIPIQRLSSGVLAEIVRRQAPSPARTSFAWQLAVGPALARVTTVTLTGTVMTVHSPDARWTKEVVRARGVVMARLQQLLGPDTVTSVRVD
jgi:hypothetical protein